MTVGFSGKSQQGPLSLRAEDMPCHSDIAFACCMWFDVTKAKFWRNQPVTFSKESLGMCPRTGGKLRGVYFEYLQPNGLVVVLSNICCPCDPY